MSDEPNWEEEEHGKDVITDRLSKSVFDRSFHKRLFQDTCLLLFRMLGVSEHNKKIQKRGAEAKRKQAGEISEKESEASKFEIFGFASEVTEFRV